MRATRLFAGLAAAAALFGAAPAGAQGVICCNLIVDVKGDWFGAIRDCAGGLKQAAPDVRAKACARVAECEAAKPHCPACDPKLYGEYRRKKATAFELFKHASDLRLDAERLVGEHLGDELKNYGFDVREAGSLAELWDDASKDFEEKMIDSRKELLKGAGKKGVEKAVERAKAVAFFIELGLSIEKARQVAGNYGDHQAESRKKAEDERMLDRAKALIEQWDNNQALYVDPIARELVTYELAIKRAKEYLETGRVSSRAWGFVRVAESQPATSIAAIYGAARELDKAITAFSRLRLATTRYLSSKAQIEANLAKVLK